MTTVEMTLMLYCCCF